MDNRLDKTPKLPCAMLLVATSILFWGCGATPEVGPSIDLMLSDAMLDTLPRLDGPRLDALKVDGSTRDAGADAKVCIPSKERCDGLDNDCNGLVDDGIPTDGHGCADPGPPANTKVVNTITIVTRTWTGTNSGTNNNKISACVDAKHCYRLDVREVDDHRIGEFDVYHFENENIPRSNIDRVEFRSVDGSDAWAVDCVEVHLDGELVHCWNKGHKWMGTDGNPGELAVWKEPLTKTCTTCYPSPLTHGPMVGAVDHDKARILYRTHATVHSTVYIGIKSDGADAAPVTHSYPTASRDYTTVATIKGLKPSTKYYYSVKTEGIKSAIFSFKTAPVPSSKNISRFAFGSGTLRAGQAIFDKIAAIKPDFFLFIGDNNYAWKSGGAAQNDDDIAPLRFHYRWQWNRSWRKKLLHTTPTLAIWDDHDFVANDSFGDWPGANGALRVFKEYWANPAYGTLTAPGTFFTWRWGDIEFFMLDDRFYRRDVSGSDPGTMLGAMQTRWLQERLLVSKAKFKFIVSGSQFTKHGHRDSWSLYPQETAALYDFIRDANIGGVILLDGDVHRSEIRIIERKSKGGYDLPAFTSSGLSSGPGKCHTGESEVVTCYDDSYSFVMLDVSTKASSPFVKATIVDATGKAVGSYTVKLLQLTP
ncbi:MAG: alkaline phosphatase D family protein [Deltaproteobacteria bacterium]|nr:alkaline phosphatase D family protein [Deltaproteobacteria bacterium]